MSDVVGIDLGGTKVAGGRPSAMAEPHDERLRLVAHNLGGRTTIRLAGHGVRAGVLGAALLATHELDEP